MRARAAMVALLERDTELGLFERVIERAADGCGSVVLVEGPAGVGKTELLRPARWESAKATASSVAAGPSSTARSASVSSGSCSSAA